MSNISTASADIESYENAILGLAIALSLTSLLSLVLLLLLCCYTGARQRNASINAMVKSLCFCWFSSLSSSSSCCLCCCCDDSNSKSSQFLTENNSYTGSTGGGGGGGFCSSLFCCFACCDDDASAIVPAQLEANARDPRRAPCDPAVQVTIIFTDIEGSGHLWQRCPSETEKVLAAHAVIVRQVVCAFKAYEVRPVGDGFMLAIVSPVSAIKLALEVMRRNDSEREYLRLLGAIQKYELEELKRKNNNTNRQENNSNNTSPNSTATTTGALSGDDVVVVVSDQQREQQRQQREEADQQNQNQNLNNHQTPEEIISVIRKETQAMAPVSDAAVQLSMNWEQQIQQQRDLFLPGGAGAGGSLLQNSPSELHNQATTAVRLRLNRLAEQAGRDSYAQQAVENSNNNNNNNLLPNQQTDLENVFGATTNPNQKKYQMEHHPQQVQLKRRQRERDLLQGGLGGGGGAFSSSAAAGGASERRNDNFYDSAAGDVDDVDLPPAYLHTAVLRMRIGIDVGFCRLTHHAETNEYDYSGDTVTRAARLEKLAHGHQILVSRKIVEDIGIMYGGKKLLDRVMFRALDEIDFGEDDQDDDVRGDENIRNNQQQQHQQGQDDTLQVYQVDLRGCNLDIADKTRQEIHLEHHLHVQDNNYRSDLTASFTVFPPLRVFRARDVDTGGGGGDGGGGGGGHQNNNDSNENGRNNHNNTSQGLIGNQSFGARSGDDNDQNDVADLLFQNNNFIINNNNNNNNSNRNNLSSPTTPTAGGGFGAVGSGSNNNAASIELPHQVAAASSGFNSTFSSTQFALNTQQANALFAGVDPNSVRSNNLNNNQNQTSVSFEQLQKFCAKFVFAALQSVPRDMRSKTLSAFLLSWGIKMPPSMVTSMAVGGGGGGGAAGSTIEAAAGGGATVSSSSSTKPNTNLNNNAATTAASMTFNTSSSAAAATSMFSGSSNNFLMSPQKRATLQAEDAMRALLQLAGRVLKVMLSRSRGGGRSGAVTPRAVARDGR